MEFPRLVYRSAADHKLVQNEGEHAAALKDGWFNTVPDALGTPAVAAAPAKVVKAEDLGGGLAGDIALPNTQQAQPVLTAKQLKAQKKAEEAAQAAAAGVGGKAPWDVS